MDVNYLERLREIDYQILEILEECIKFKTKDRNIKTNRFSNTRESNGFKRFLSPTGYHMNNMFSCPYVGVRI